MATTISRTGFVTGHLDLQFFPAAPVRLVDQAPRLSRFDQMGQLNLFSQAVLVIPDCQALLEDLRCH